MRRFVIGVAMATAGVLGATACASSTGGHPVATGGSRGFPGPSTSSSQAPMGGGLTDQQAQAALLTAAEVGGGFKAQPSDNTSTPLPCDQQAPPLDQQFQPSAKAKTDLVSPDGQAYLSEEVIGYGSTATADQALAAGEKGLSCRTATVKVNGKPIQYRIDPVEDVTSRVGVTVDKALLWTVHTSVVTIQLVATKIGAQLVVLSFAASPKADTSKLPDQGKILKDALTKVKAHI